MPWRLLRFFNRPFEAILFAVAMCLAFGGLFSAAAVVMLVLVGGVAMDIRDLLEAHRRHVEWTDEQP